MLLSGFYIHNINAQDFSIGAAGIYGDDIENGGIHLRGYYNLKGEHICFGPEYSYFFSRTENINGTEVTKKLSEVNFNIHYIFELDEKWGVYPLLGANVTFEKEEIELLNGEFIEEKETIYGANLGFGVHRSFGEWVVFAEYDHLFSTFGKNFEEESE